jgi:hypothetical protein
MDASRDIAQIGIVANTEPVRSSEFHWKKDDLHLAMCSNS